MSTKLQGDGELSGWTTIKITFFTASPSKTTDNFLLVGSVKLCHNMQLVRCLSSHRHLCRQVEKLASPSVIVVYHVTAAAVVSGDGLLKKTLPLEIGCVVRTAGRYYADPLTSLGSASCSMSGCLYISLHLLTSICLFLSLVFFVLVHCFNLYCIYASHRHFYCKVRSVTCRDLFMTPSLSVFIYNLFQTLAVGTQ